MPRQIAAEGRPVLPGAQQKEVGAGGLINHLLQSAEGNENGRDRKLGGLEVETPELPVTHYGPHGGAEADHVLCFSRKRRIARQHPGFLQAQDHRVVLFQVQCVCQVVIDRHLAGLEVHLLAGARCKSPEPIIHSKNLDPAQSTLTGL